MRFRRDGDKIEELKKISLFDNLPRRELVMIAANLDEVTVPEGETLIREGHHNDAFWIVREGTAAMYVGGRKTRDVGPGDFFGATSMLDGKPAVATVVATSDIKAFVASHDQFRALEGNDTIAPRLMSYALQRLREDLEIHGAQQ